MLSGKVAPGDYHIISYNSGRRNWIRSCRSAISKTKILQASPGSRSGADPVMCADESLRRVLAQ